MKMKGVFLGTTAENKNKTMSPYLVVAGGGTTVLFFGVFPSLLLLLFSDSMAPNGVYWSEHIELSKYNHT